METEPDFSGYATKAGLTCSDGRVIMKDAFAHQHETTVPLVWQHGHTDPKNVLGHAVLENRDDGVYARAYFNGTPEGQHVKTLVQHGDVVSLSIYANQLKERSKQVFHGMIRELSVVLSGANPGALIDQVRLEHADGSIDTLEDEAIIFTGLELEHGMKTYTTKSAESTTELVDGVVVGTSSRTNESVRTRDDGNEPNVAYSDMTHAEGDKTLAEVLDTLNEEQRTAVNFVLGAALEDAKGGEVKQSAIESEAVTADDESDAAKAEAAKTSEAAPADEKTSEAAPADETKTEDALAHMEGNTSMTKNVFDQTGAAAGSEGATLTHDQFSTILTDVKNHNGSLKESILAHASTFGITDINFLFPDAKALENNPELHARRMEWVAKVLDSTKHTPFAKVKSIVADITAEEARARGYVKGTKKVDEVIQLLKRTTGPATIYKKQRLDRDDILDITDMDVVAFLKAEMRLMIEEEIARAILVGDGRPAISDDKVKDPAGALDGVGIRSILNDSDFYSVKVELVANVAPKEAVKGLVRARAKYRGTGKPTLFISDNFLTDIMLEEDKFGRPLYETEASLRDKLRVESIVTVDLFDEYDSLFAIMVNLADYSIGANKGGELTNFEDFDIDFNQYKYLQETRLSGALTKPFSAVVVSRGLGTLVAPAAPSFNGVTNTVTVPATAGVVYQANGVTVAAGALVITETTEVDAVPDDGFYFAANTTRSWTFTFTP